MTEGRLSRSWRLTRAAWEVVRTDRAMLKLGAIAVLANVGAVGVMLALAGVYDQSHLQGGRLVVAALLLAYPLTFLGAFFNTAIAAAAAAAREGRHLTVGEALAVPTRRIGTIAMWALIAAIVGFVIEQLARRLPLGSIVSRLLGLGWSVVSLFVIPILALEDRSATESLKRSAHVIKERWGEGIAGLVTITAWTLLVIIPGALVFIVLGVAVSSVPALLIAVIALGVLSFVALIVLQLLVRQTFAVALYRFATTGDGQAGFAQSDLESAFRRKRGLLG